MLRVLFLCAVPAALGIIVRDPPPSPNDYKYSYNIEDPTTGDSKSQHEVRQGDVVTGAYTVLGPDGTKRTVEYTADPKNGFKAVISEDPGTPPVVTQPPVPYHYNTVQYRAPPPAPTPLYTSVLPEQNNYVEEQPAIYFNPHNEVEQRLPFNGHYFIPTNKYSIRN
ncbi:larval cuticle protein A2B-like [Trichoplusia ni]|uniref:Larval cuticle protein A2B-like n=1 Tax=Trichoplusia ni TaxID=7111 RepID=A0A7E5W5S2_TRINI|nr:larval cuticle protein A2B-like [Trichoplusia ni]